MPVYEFVCEDCNRVFNFLARTPEAAGRRPACPRCGKRRMRRRFSLFATVRRGSERAKESPSPPGDGGDDLSPAQEARMEQALAELERDMGSLDENNPRQMAAVLRRLSAAAGENLGPEMDEMIRRLEAGEDPEKVEEAMADVMGEEGGGGAPSYDDGLYDL